MIKKVSYTLILLIVVQLSTAQSIYDWRGPGRSGVYQEGNLLKEWPDEGPGLIWAVEDLPAGHSSVSIGNNKLYLTGIEDTMDVLFALDMEGNILWKTPYGRAWTNSYSESRATPTLEGNRIYVSSAMGDIACVNAENGTIIWHMKAIEELEGAYPRWGLAESLLLFEDKVFFTPGGDQTTMVALDKMTGKMIWKSESLKDDPSFTSPLLINYSGQHYIIQVTTDYIFSVNPDNGDILWKFDYGQYKGGRNNNTNTPLYENGRIFVTSGYNHKSVMLELSPDGRSVSLAWLDSTLDVHHGGVVKVGDYIYGSSWEHNRMGNWVCLNWETGEIMYEKEWYNKGSIIAADGMLYCYEEKTGNLALVEAKPDDFKVVSSFKNDKGYGPYWSHPVIHKGILYVRHGDALMAYEIKSK